MLAALLYGLHDWFSPFNLFRYITFRTTLCVITALCLSFILAPSVIGRLKKFSVTQYIRDDGPKSHLTKTGTPTMGGVLILSSII
ncbi:MAG: phospho-N-acetylmuramoyl-pentapeptide-transferase, partial [Nitrospirae bacterium]|nr:phospho-N-acetylmuramoyl-pentapeptide-transferase [Nitrospirota bacterium]